MCAVWLRCARSAAILRSNVPVMSTCRAVSGAPGAPPVTQTSATVCAANPASASSGCAHGLRASG